MNDSEKHVALHEIILENHEVSEGIFKDLNATDVALLDCIKTLEERIKDVERYLQLVRATLEVIEAEKGEDQFV